MNYTIGDLWRGNIAPWDNCGSHDPAIDRIVSLMDRSREDLSEIATKQQMELFEKYAGYADAYADLMMEQAFIEGFSLGTGLMSQALSG